MIHNLIAEMAINKITRKELSEATGIKQRTLSDKLSGRTEFTLAEMIAIRDACFPEKTLDYLFATEKSA